MTAARGLAAAVDHVRGAKIASLVDTRGSEWLLPPGKRVPAGRAFTEAEMGGWDECAPSIVSCLAADGRRIPDHGDLWDVAWDEEGDGLTVTDSAWGYRFSRTVTETADGAVRLGYEVVSDRDQPFLWAAHPQFSAPPGTTVDIEAGAVVDVLDEIGQRRPLDGVLRSMNTVPEGGCRKYYVVPEDRLGEAVLRVPGRGELVMTWDAEVAPYLGVWFDRGAYAREPVIALEPSTGYYDSLQTAVRNDRVLELEAGRPCRWWVEVATR